MTLESGKTPLLVFDRAVLKDNTRHTSSKGTIPKYTDGKHWIKTNKLGYESVSEVLCSRVIASLGIDCVMYYPCLLRTEDDLYLPACMSYNFVPEDCSETSIGALIKKYTGAKNSREVYQKMENYKHGTKLQFVLDALSPLNIESVLLKGMAEYIWLDEKLLNTDRHVYNMVLLEKNNRYSFVNFDFGSALLSELDDFPMELTLYRCLDKVKKKAKPFSRRFSRQLDMFTDYLPNPTPKFNSILIKDLYDYYPAAHIDRARAVLRQRFPNIKFI